MANAQLLQAESRVAVLVDCDNTSPEVLEHALRVVAQFGRVVLRRLRQPRHFGQQLARVAGPPGLHALPAVSTSTPRVRTHPISR